MTLPAPYPPLVSGGEGLDRYPGEAAALAARMAAIYAVPVDQVLPVRGLTHGLELVWRLAARDGGSVEAPKAEPYERLAAIYPAKGAPAAVVIRALGSPEAVAEMAARLAPALETVWDQARLPGTLNTEDLARLIIMALPVVMSGWTVITLGINLWLAGRIVQI